MSVRLQIPPPGLQQNAAHGGGGAQRNNIGELDVRNPLFLSI